MKRHLTGLPAMALALACVFAPAIAQDGQAGQQDDAASFADIGEGMWEIEVAYPHFTSGSAVAAQANAEGDAAAEAEFSSFLAKAKAEVPEMRELGSSAVYLLQVTPTVTTDLPELCSGYVERLEATGGANLNHTFSVFNYAQDDGGARFLELADLFYDGSDGTEAASKAVLAEIMAWDSQPSYVADGIWTELSPEQAERFVITESGLLFLFNKFELGAGAEGVHTVLAPYDSLAGLDYEGFLKPLFDDLYKHNIDVLRSGRWVLSQIVLSDGATLSTPTDASGALVEDNWVEFRSDGLSGMAGLNSFSGEYQAREDGALQIGTLAMTRALNPPDSIADRFEHLIPGVVGFMLKDAALYLELPSDAGTLVFLNSGVDGVW